MFGISREPLKKMKPLQKYYLSVKDLTFQKKTWTEAENNVFRSAIAGKRQVEFELRKPYDDSVYQTQYQIHKAIEQLNIDTKKFKIDIKVEMNYNLDSAARDATQKLKELKMLNVKSTSCGSYYKISASFPEICDLDLRNEFHKTYLKSLSRVTKRLADLTLFEQKCCSFLDDFYVDATIAINNNQRWAEIQNPAESPYDEPYDPLGYKIITKELKKVSHLRFTKRIDYGSLCNDEVILVWNFDKQDTRIWKSQVPDSTYRSLLKTWKSDFLDIDSNKIE